MKHFTTALMVLAIWYALVAFVVWDFVIPFGAMDGLHRIFCIWFLAVVAWGVYGARYLR